MTRYQVDSEQVAAATQGVQGTIGRIQSEVASLLGQLHGLQGSWSGQASTAFQAAVADWRRRANANYGIAGPKPGGYFAG